MTETRKPDMWRATINAAALVLVLSYALPYVYLLMTVSLSLAVRALESRLQRHRDFIGDRR